MSEATVVNPNQLVNEMAARRQQEAMVGAFVDVQTPQSVENFEDYLSMRPDEPASMNPDSTVNGTDMKKYTDVTRYSNAIMDMYPHDTEPSELKDRLAGKDLRYLAATYRGLAASDYGGNQWEAKQVEDIIVNRLSDYAEKHGWSEETAENRLNQVLTFMHGKPETDEAIENEALAQQRILDEVEAGQEPNNGANTPAAEASDEKTPLQVAETESQDALAELKNLLSQDPESFTEEEFDGVCEELYKVTERYLGLRDDLSEAEKDEYLDQLQSQVDQLVDDHNQRTDEAEAREEAKNLWAELEAMANAKGAPPLQEFSLLVGKVREASERYTGLIDIPEEEKQAALEQMEERLKSLITARYQLEGDKYEPKAEDEQQAMRAEIEKRAERSPEELNRAILQYATEVRAALQAGNEDDQEDAQEELDLYFAAYAKNMDFTKEDKRDKYNSILTYIQTGILPNGETKTPSAPQQPKTPEQQENVKPNRLKRFAAKAGGLLLAPIVAVASLPDTAKRVNEWANSKMPEQWSPRKKGVVRAIGATLTVAAGVGAVYVARRINNEVFNSGSGAGVVEATPSPSGDPEVVVPAPEQDIDSSNFTYPIDWAESNGLNLGDLHELADKAQAAGENVKWHGSGTKQWLEINGRSDVDFIVNTLNKLL